MDRNELTHDWQQADKHRRITGTLKPRWPKPDEPANDDVEPRPAA